MRLLVAAVMSLSVAGVGAHAEPSGPGQFEDPPTTRHLRVHEPSHDNDNKEERGVKRAREEIGALLDTASTALESQPMWKHVEMMLNDQTLIEKLPTESDLHARTSTDEIKKILTEGKLYVDLHNSIAGNIQTTLFQTLAARYGEKKMTTIIEIAKRDIATARTAKRLEWLLDMKDPNDVFFEMRRAGPRRSLFDDLKIFSWFEYVDDFNKVYPEKAKFLHEWLDSSNFNYIGELFDHKSRSELTKVIMFKLSESWLAAEYDPSRVFKLLDPVKDEVIQFRSPRFTEWMHFVTDFNARQPEKQKRSYSWVLEQEYGAENLLRMLQNAGDSMRIKRLAVDLLSYMLEEELGGSNYLKHLQKFVNSLEKGEEVNFKPRTNEEYIRRMHSLMNQ